MNPAIDIVGPYTLRSALILTNAYVGALLSSVLPTSVRVCEHNQLIVYVDFTLGSLTDAQLKIEFNAPGAADLYQETDETNSAASSINTRGVNQVLHKLAITGKYRFAIPIADGDVKVSIIGTGTTTSSSAKITFSLAKTYA